MNVEKITQDGDYIHTGFAIHKAPTEINRTAGEKEVEMTPEFLETLKGTMYIFFKKDEKNYYIENRDIFGNEEKTPYGVFQPYMIPPFILQPFHFSFDEDKKATIVHINVLNSQPNEDGSLDFNDSETEDN